MNLMLVPRMRLLSAFALLLAAGCSGHSREQLAHVKSIADRVSKNQAPSTQPASATPLALPELVERAKQRSPEIMRSELRGIVDEADFDQEASAGLPRVGVESDYGRPALVRRDESEGLLRVSPGLQWDVVRMLQMGRMKRLRVRTKEAAALQQQLALEQVELEVVRRYAELEAARAAAAMAEARAASAERAARVAQLQGLADSTAPETIHNAALLTRQLGQARGRAELAQARLASLCGLQPGEQAAPFAEPGKGPDPLPLGEYLQLVLANSEGLKLADVRIALSAERARVAKAERWSMFRLSSNGGDLLQALSASPFAVMSWTYALLDQGDFNRRLVKARADTLLSRLDRQDEADRLLDTGGRVWLALLDSAVEQRKAGETLRQAKLAHRIASAQVADGIAAPQLERSAALTLASAEMDSKLRTLDHMIANTQYRLLGGAEVPGGRAA